MIFKAGESFFEAREVLLMIDINEKIVETFFL